MRKLRSVVLVLSVLALLALHGCVQICEQRITMRYHADSDTLYVLIHYDGVMDSGKNEFGRGGEQLAKFIAEGEVLIGDWPFHLKPSDAREITGDEASHPAAMIALAKAINESVRVEPIGRHRDAKGRIGGVQLVTITKASELIAKLNAMINEAGRKEFNSANLSNYPGTAKRWKAAFADGHTWVKIDGHALRAEIPVHPHEWNAIKSVTLYDAVTALLDTQTNKGEQEALANMTRVLQILASAPIGYSESNGIVSVRLGDPARPSTFRLHIRDEYKPNLEESLTQNLPQELDGALVAAALKREQPGAEVGDGVRALVEWGPRESVVRAVLGAARSDDSKLAEAAYDWLKRFAKSWNGEHNLPAVPGDPNNRQLFLASVEQWCRNMTDFPDPSKLSDRN